MDLDKRVAMAPIKDAQRLRRAAERKAEDQFQLAFLFYNGGEGLTQDRVAAANWLCKAAAQEHAGAQASLGHSYANGEGVEQNCALAASWLSKAADQGDGNAQGHLGVLFHKGTGVEQNDALAVAWWEKAAVKSDAPSQYNLGVGYMDGTYGLTKNAHCAKIYMMAAAKQGYARAIEDLKLLQACAACGAPDASRTCQGCMSVTGLSTARYCTPACQAAHWKAHAPDCGPCQCHRCR